MPELPEVETTLRGIQPHISGETIQQINIYQPALRWPVSAEIVRLQGHSIDALDRRAKYLLLKTAAGYAMIHLGMSGSLRICDPDAPLDKHDHVEFVFGNGHDSGKALRLRDPRRFGAVLWTADPQQHSLIKHLGQEPLSNDFTAEYLFALSRGKMSNIKAFIMDAKKVVGVGNIYASESLFMAGINPKTHAGRISLPRYEKLIAAIKEVLANAIAQGGTTLRDFVSADGQTGYFQIQLQVYGRAGKACKQCGGDIRQITQNQRSTFYCPNCQR